MNGCCMISKNDFRDKLVLQLISKYGKIQQAVVLSGRPPRSQCRSHHGSTIMSSKGRCQYCRIAQKRSYFSQRKCLDQPTFCQTRERDCHALWHAPGFDATRELWVLSKKQKTETAVDSPPHTRGCPKGSSRNQGKYLSRSF